MFAFAESLVVEFKAEGACAVLKSQIIVGANLRLEIASEVSNFPMAALSRM